MQNQSNRPIQPNWNEQIKSKDSISVLIFLKYVPNFILIFLLFMLGICLAFFTFIPLETPYSPVKTFWHFDFRYWSDWVSWCCWGLFWFSLGSMFLSVFLPLNEGRIFFLRQSFWQKVLFLFCVFTIWSIWYRNATLPLEVVFEPVYSPITNYLNVHYTYPLLEYQTTGEGHNPMILPIVFTTILTVLLITWRTTYYVRRYLKSKNTQPKNIQSKNIDKKNALIVLLAILILPNLLGADVVQKTTLPPPPAKVPTSVGIYDVQSKEDLRKFTTADIRKLVDMEDGRIAKNDRRPHPILVYCFEERSFKFTAGKYKDAEIKYRLHVPQKIDPNKKYPLAVHLHGIGEAGNGTTMSLAHLHSILPLMVGPEQRDFFLLVTQCPSKDNSWSFRESRDGNLDIVLAAILHVIKENPIDEDMLSVFGLSSGGAGLWDLLSKRPNIFAAAVPTSCHPDNVWDPMSPILTPIWAFVNSQEPSLNIAHYKRSKNMLESRGGFFKYTIFDLTSHNAWRPAMYEYNCFGWMISQRRGSWFNPPPERKIYTFREMSDCFHAFFLPILISAGLLILQRTPITNFLNKQITKKFYTKPKPKIQTESEAEKSETKTEKFEQEKIDSRIDNKIVKASKIVQPISATKIIRQEIDHATNDQTANDQTANDVGVVDLCASYREWGNAAETGFVYLKFVSIKEDGETALFLDRIGKKASIPIDALSKSDQELLQKYKETLGNSLKGNER